MRVDPPLITGLPAPRLRGPATVAPGGSEPRRPQAPTPPERTPVPAAVTDRLPSARLAALRIADPRRDGADPRPEPPALRAFRTVETFDGGAELLTRGGRIDLSV
ncbi:hypothetical protein [Sediminicurvatus halobius]|uniref:Uncharacterized protein n=1 Tax=Sediminicurvatus halobius TaxID=2182432 RepID=A0A2U2MY88_9GAMM|nr:hypothetical protein [Spiribacter halobius]PWG61971.1 hypothetical protein DEM34_13995 [Spiribacter halobius]UEX78377.1 hypothetical protein LMH63_01670 [Spiribacter halobius]